jgi:hypothetical protein
MSRISSWIHALSGAGALDNAASACQQQRDEAALVEARLARIEDLSGSVPKNASKPGGLASGKQR